MSPSLRRAAVPALAVALSLIGLAASGAALADYLAPAPAWCEASGCAVVRASAWAHPLGVPLPAVGVGFFAVALLLCLTATSRRAIRARRALAVAGGVGAVGLIAVQGLVVGAWCRLCLIADVSAVLLAALVVVRAAWPPAGRAALVAVLALGAVAAAGPAAMPGRAPAPPPLPSGPALPDVIAREDTPGVVDVVDFIDFECPFCRELHGRLTQAMTRAAVPVRVVRKMVPLDRHPGALPAAIAWCCADRQGKGDVMAEALLAAPLDQLTPAGCERLAAELGLDLERYRADAVAPEIRARIDRDRADARAAGVKTLPTVYIGARGFAGASATVDELVAALEQAHR